MSTKPSKEEAKNAVRTLLSFIGDDTEREGLVDTPDRVIASYDEMFCGYNQNPADILATKFNDVANFQDFILLKSIRFTSCCEHHMLPIIGFVDIAYIPNNCVVGISKLARLVDVFAKRLQIQEKMTVEIATSLQQHLEPLGVAIKITATHSCMTLRGVLKNDTMMITTHFTGQFTDYSYQQKFFNLIS